MNKKKILTEESMALIIDEVDHYKCLMCGLMFQSTKEGHLIRHHNYEDNK